MAQTETQFNFVWSSLVIMLSSALVALGLQDINRTYDQRHRNVTHAQMEELITAMHGSDAEWKVLKR